MTKIPITINSPLGRNTSWTIAKVIVGVTICLLWAALPAAAQTAGQGAIQGTVADSTGAVIPNATITATNSATKIATQRVSSSAGYFVISPLPPGTYSVQVTAKGFKTQVQDSLVVDALQTLGFNPVMSVGAETQTVTVSTAPPVLDTADATLGTIVENDTYSNLPLQMNNAQRDPTAFGALSPGAQGGTRLPVIGGTGNFLGQLYLDGMPAETVSQQGDNRLVSQALSVDAVDQFQVLTSTPPAEYMGAGAENFTMKSGGVRYHGQVSDFVRNTVFDSWGFTQKAATVKNAQGATVPAPKAVEHQNELSVSAGGPVPFTGHKLFFFVAYDKFHSRKGANPQLYTIPTDLMRTGDFTELSKSTAYPTGNPGTGQTGEGTNNNAFLYDPTTNNCVGSTCTRTPFQGTKGGVATYNVIPSGMISPIAKAMQSFLPEPTSTSSVYNNYFGGYPSGFDNHLIDYRVDFELSSNQRISALGAMGVVNYLNNYGSPFLPPPYIGGDLANIFPKNYMVEDEYTIKPDLVNQFKYGFTRFFQNIQNATQGVKPWEASTLGITNLPGGQASEEFPEQSFATTPAFGSANTTWTGNTNGVSTQVTTPNNFALVDNLLLTKGKHALTFGITYQWQEINNANPATFTGVLQLPYNAYSTANFAAGSSSLNVGSATSPSGFSYASYLLGAVGGSPSIGLQPVSELGGRFRPFSPYVRDSYRLTSKVTLDLGLRWDYLPPYQEVKNRWTFLNPNLTNPLTGSLGMLQFAGNYGGSPVSCNCTTPVQTYWKNWGPRLGLAYSINDKTVIRAGFAQVFSQAGGVGGRGGAFNGTGQTGFNMSAIGPTEATTGASALPSFFLNNSAGFTAAAPTLANTGLFGPGFVYPSAPTPSVTSQELNTGYYVNSTTGKFVSASGVSFADPYLSSRAPEIVLYNFGFERAITKDMTLAVNYVGNESHFIVNSGTTRGNARGYWSNELDPKYLAALGGVADSTGKVPLLDAPATPANVAILQAHVPGAPSPAYYQTAAGASTAATIAHMLVAFPQYSGVNDTWGNVGNFSYNSLQITLVQRMSNGLTFNVNYTYAKNVGDDGTFRSGFNIPSAAISHGTQSFKQDRMDRSLTAISIPQTFHAFGVYQLPFGKGKIGNDSTLVRWLAGGWQLSGIYSATTGTPMAATWSGCSASTYPGQGQCMPDLNSSFSGSARINGSFGKGPNGYQAASLGKVAYVDVNAFATPQNISTVSTQQYLIGNAPRTAAFALRNPGTWDLDAGLRRSFPIHEDLQFVFEVDSINVWNHVTFDGPGASWSSGSTTFGTVTGVSGSPGPRDFQFAGHLNF